MASKSRGRAPFLAAVLLGTLTLHGGRARAQRDRESLGWFGSADEGDQSRWIGGIDRGGRIQCRIAEQGGNCSSNSNCILNLSAREEHLRTSFCMHERMERPYLGALISVPACSEFSAHACNTRADTCDAVALAPERRCTLCVRVLGRQANTWKAKPRVSTPAAVATARSSTRANDLIRSGGTWRSCRSRPSLTSATSITKDHGGSTHSIPACTANTAAPTSVSRVFCPSRRLPSRVLSDAFPRHDAHPPLLPRSLLLRQTPAAMTLQLGEGEGARGLGRLVSSTLRMMCVGTPSSPSSSPSSSTTTPTSSSSSSPITHDPPTPRELSPL